MCFIYSIVNDIGNIMIEIWGDNGYFNGYFKLGLNYDFFWVKIVLVLINWCWFCNWVFYMVYLYVF